MKRSFVGNLCFSVAGSARKSHSQYTVQDQMQTAHSNVAGLHMGFTLVYEFQFKTWER